MDATPHLHTARLLLRPPLVTDRGFVAALLTDGAVRRYLGGLVAAADLEAAINRNLAVQPGEHVWCVETLRGALVGLVSITGHKDGAEYELSYQFAQQAWGQGYACEALKALLPVAHGKMGLARIIAETQMANEASVSLLRKLGFVEYAQITRFGHAQAMFALDWSASTA